MAQDTRHSYTGRYKFNQDGDLYIHQHAYCIGRAMNGSSMDDDSLAKVFSSQKTTASTAAKTFYKKLYIENLHMTETELALLKGAFEVGEDELLKMIDAAAKSAMESMMDKDSLEKLLNFQKDAVKNAKDLFDENSKKQLKAFNDILEALSKSSELITSDYSASLAQLLSHLKAKKFISLSQMGVKMGVALDNFIKKNNIMAVKDDQIQKAIASLKTFAEVLETGQTKGKDKNLLTQNNITDVIDSLFSPAFSEAVASVLQQVSETNAIETIKGALSGTNTYKGVLTDYKGRIIGTDNKSPAQGKVDFKFENIAITLQQEGNAQSQNVSMSIGISNKLYRSLKFSNGEKMPALTFDSGSAGTLQEAIDAVFPGSKTRYKYLAYNTMAHWQPLGSAVAALNDILLTRQIVRMFASRGGSADLAQYIFVNGEVVSIMDLLAYVTDTSNDLSKSKTQLTASDSQAAALSVQGRPALAKAVAIRSAAQRTKEVNHIIKTSTISARLRVHKLVQAIAASK